MPHVAFLPFSGVRVREQEVLALGMTLPGLRERGAAVSQLPALGLLTLAGMLPQDWTCSYRPVSEANEALLEEVVAERPTLAALSALTASVDEACHFSRQLGQRGIRTVVGGPLEDHATFGGLAVAPHIARAQSARMAHHISRYLIDLPGQID